MCSFAEWCLFLVVTSHRCYTWPNGAQVFQIPSFVQLHSLIQFSAKFSPRLFYFMSCLLTGRRAAVPYDVER